MCSSDLDIPAAQRGLKLQSLICDIIPISLILIEALWRFVSNDCRAMDRSFALIQYSMNAEQILFALTCFNKYPKR